MKKYILLSSAILFFAAANGQSVGINNDGSAPNLSAMLDVKNPNKGFLAPRVALTGTGDVATIPTPATALLVFNTATAGTSPSDVTPGYYYYTGTAWTRFNTGSSVATPSWLLTGNAGTVDGTNFIGTTDDVPFNVRVNNQRAGRIDRSLSNTFWGYQAGNANTTGSFNTANGNSALFSNTTGTSNTANGAFALVFNTEGRGNTANGAGALQSNTTGGNNSANGQGALLSNTTGSSNTANGVGALLFNTTGDNNTAIGLNALRSNTTGTFNIASGVNALRSNKTGSGNTANGNFALFSNVTGIDLTALGSGADVSVDGLTNATAIGSGAIVNASNTIQLGNSNVSSFYFGTGSLTTTSSAANMFYDNTTGQILRSTAGSGGSAVPAWLLTGNAGTVDGTNFIGTTDNVPFNVRVNNQKAGRIDHQVRNTFWGYQAGNVTTGSDNTATGYQSLLFNTTGSSNTANGGSALQSNTSGFGNTANGASALLNNTTGGQNTATGSSALQNNTTGVQNTANGFNALRSNTTGSNNTANGISALINNTEGQSNTATGVSALQLNTTGGLNTANGASALQSNTIGQNNTANGSFALFSNTTGSSNTANGRTTLFFNTTGSNLTALGFGADVSVDGLTNATAIGNGAIVNASNKIRLGNSAVTVIEGQVAYSFPSDQRFKYNIKNDVPGLEFIKKLTPVTYYFDEKKLDEYTKTGIIRQDKDDIAVHAAYTGEKQLRTGFLAQDVEKAAQSLGYNFDGVHAPANSKDHYSVAYSQFIMPLVKGMQQQQQIIEEQKSDIEILKLQVAELMKAVKTLSHK